MTKILYQNLKQVFKKIFKIDINKTKSFKIFQILISHVNLILEMKKFKSKSTR